MLNNVNRGKSRVKVNVVVKKNRNRYAGEWRYQSYSSLTFALHPNSALCFDFRIYASIDSLNS
jgi:hypothetical protein